MSGLTCKPARMTRWKERVCRCVRVRVCVCVCGCEFQLTCAALLEGLDGVNGRDDQISEGCGEEASDRHTSATGIVRPTQVDGLVRSTRRGMFVRIRRACEL